MNIHIRDLIEYLECPMRYRLRNIDKVTTRSYNRTRGTHTGTVIYREFDQAMHKIIAHIFHNVQAGRYPSLYNMKQMWSKLWLTYRDGHTDAVQEMSNWRDERRQKEKQGVRVFTEMLERMRDKHGEPIAIDYDYEIQVGQHTVRGTLDLVRVVDNNVIELIDWKNDDRPTATHLRNDLEITAAVLAFRQIWGYTEERVTFYGIMTGKPQETKRVEKDFTALEMILDQVERAIDAEIYYPVLNYKCFECPFDLQCEQRRWVPGPKPRIRKKKES